jgi:uncharacterized membrane protein YsdA (DUF1294 family)/cold shock CspA family protein
LRTKGKIVSWNDAKGYGFIAPLDGGKQVFLHVSALGNRDRRPEINGVVTYSLDRDSKGRARAANATLAGTGPRRKSSRRRGNRAALWPLVFLASVTASAMAGYLSVIVPVAYLAMSLVTFAAYAIDKSAAQRGAWRTPEATLLGLGLAGGWPGGLVAQQVLRHKSRKTSFRVAFWFTVLLNCAALAWLHTEDGIQALRQLLA